LSRTILPPSVSTRADPITLLFNLFKTDLQIVADDGTTLLTPENYIILEKAPYAQEGAGEKPQVIVGPRKPPIRRPISLPPIWYEIDDPVRVRIITRNWDGGDFGFTLDGSAARYKVITSIVSILNANFTNPDGTGTWTWIRPMDNGTDSDENPEGTHLYRTDITIGCRRYSQID